MILVDTSVWVDHLRAGDSALTQALQSNLVLIHPFVLGELACGNLKSRAHVLQLLAGLPGAAHASDREVLMFIESRKLMGRGIGYVDAHLLASAALETDATLWTRDRRLTRVADELNLKFEL